MIPKVLYVPALINKPISNPIPDPDIWSDSVIGRSYLNSLKFAPMETQGTIRWANVIISAFSPVCILDDFIPVL